MSDTLTVQLARTGLIQFGHFTQPDGAAWPVMLNLAWLPSYPALLGEVAAALEALSGDWTADRMLATARALPIGVAFSQRTGLPLTYATDDIRDYTAAFAIEGAYDVGHPTVLLVDVLVDATQAQVIAGAAKRVGLNVSTIVAVVDFGLGAQAQLAEAGFVVQAVLTLRAMLAELATVGWLAPTLRASVEEWLGSVDFFA